MSDPFKKIAVGDIYPKSASFRNAVVDMVNWWRQQAPGSRNGASSNQSTIIQCKNDSGADQTRFAALAITDVFPDPDDNETAFCNGPVLHGDVPDAATPSDRFCVLLSPAKDGKIVPACVAGVCVAKINVNSEADTTCGISTTTVLQSGSPGAHILWKESGTGLKLASIRIGGGDSSSFRLAKITSGGSSTAPTQSEADAYAVILDGVETDLDTCVAALITVSDPGLAAMADTIAAVAADTDEMIDDPSDVAEDLAGHVDTLQGFKDASQALIDAHDADIAGGGSGTLTANEVTDHNAIIAACAAAISDIKGVAEDLAEHMSGTGGADIYARNDYGVLVATGESVTVYCELLAEGESISGFVYIARSADDGEYRIVTCTCAGIT